MNRHVWHTSWSQARNSQELIDSTTGVVLVLEVQPGCGTVDGMDDLPFLPPQPKTGPYLAARYAGVMGVVLVICARTLLHYCGWIVCIMVYYVMCMMSYYVLCIIM